MTTLPAIAAFVDVHGWQILALIAVWPTLLLATAWTLAVVLRRASAAVRYCVWQFALLGLLVLPVVFVLLPGIPLGFSLGSAAPTPPVVVAYRPTFDASPDATAMRPVLAKGVEASEREWPSAIKDGAKVADRSGSAEAGLAERRITGGVWPAKSVPRPKAVDPVARRSASWSARFVGVWSLGVAVQIGWLLVCLGRARRLVRAADALNDARIAQIYADLKRQFSIRGAVRLVKAVAVDVPVVVGIRRPCILLPADCVEWSADKVRMVLSHELAHVERRDVFWQLATRATAAAYWVHPLAWLALHRMRQERERACDDRVLGLGVPAVDYAAELAEFAAALAGRPSPLLGSVGMAEQLPLEDRVRLILDGSITRNLASAKARGVLLGAVACLVLLLGVLRPFAPVRTTATEAPPPGRAKSDDSATKAKSESPKPAEKPADASAAKPASKADKAAPDDPKQLPTTGKMLVRTVGPDGEPIQGAKLFANVGWWDRNATDWDKHWKIENNNYVTGPDGTVEIKLPKLVEDLRLWARAEGHVPLFAIWWPKRDPAVTAIPDEFTYYFQKGTSLGGMVTNDEGQPIEGVKVEASYHGKPFWESGGRAVFDNWLAEGDAAVRTDAEGRWQLNNVPPGDDIDIKVRLSHPRYIDDGEWGRLQKEQHVALKSLRDETAVIVMHRGSVVSGTVTDPEGHPLKDAVVIWGDRPYWEPGSQEVRTDEQGAYRFPPLPPGPMHVTVVAEGWMPVRTKIQIPHRSLPLDFALKKGKKLRIRLVDQSGNAIPRVGVAIRKWQGAESLYNIEHPNVLSTHIPRMSDEHGIYEWNWAPDSPVEFSFNREGFADTQASLTADDGEQVTTLLVPLRLSGTVVDAETGQPIEQFLAVPILHFREDFPSVEHDDAAPCAAGKFSMEFARTDVRHALQIEATGYVTVRVGPYSVGETPPPLELRMMPAERFVGRVSDETGRPVANARVYVGSYSEHLYLSDLNTEDGGRQSNYRVKTNDQGEFEIPHQLERYALTVVADAGYGEADRSLGELPGVIKLRRWARISGTLVQSGKPVADWNLKLGPIRDEGGDAPRGDVTFYAKTDADGSFAFDRVPPVACWVEGSLHWSVDGPLSSARSMPIFPAPGEELVLSLGGGGAEVTGKLALDPPPTADFDYHFGLNNLVALRPGVKPPDAIAQRGFDWRRGWSDAWINSLEGRAYLQTLHHFFVKPDPDGQFRISGVEPGEYDFAIHLYGSTEGCLVHPVGVAIVRVTVPEGQSAVNLGTIKVPALPGLKVGDAAPELEFQTADGRKQKLSDARGKYLLVDFWASWCGPCVAKMPEVEALRQKYEGLGLLVVGANLDQEPRRARELLLDKKLPWGHAFLGDWSSTDAPKRFAVSSAPTYVLVGPDGRVLAHETSLKSIETILDKAPSGNTSR